MPALIRRSILYVLLASFMLANYNMAPRSVEAQIQLEPTRYLLGFTSWEHEWDTHAIRAQLAATVPEGYVIGPIAFCKLGSMEDTTLWFVSLDYPIDFDMEGPRSLIQVWQEDGLSGSLVMLQEFSQDETYVHEMALISVDNRVFLYAICAQVLRWTQLVCFEVRVNEPHLQLISQESFKDLFCWFVPDLKEIGSAFIFLDWATFYSTGEEPEFGRLILRICPLSEQGFMTKYTLRVEDLLSEEEMAIMEELESAEELRSALNTKLRLESHWLERIEDDDYASRGVKERANLDGSTYWSRGGATGWEENTIDRVVIAR